MGDYRFPGINFNHGVVPTQTIREHKFVVIRRREGKPPARKRRQPFPPIFAGDLGKVDPIPLRDCIDQFAALLISAWIAVVAGVEIP